MTKSALMLAVTLLGMAALILSAEEMPAQPVSGPASPAEVAAFRKECKALADAAEQQGTMSVVGQAGWLFFDSELRHLAAGEFWGEAAAKVSRAARPDLADPLPAILDVQQQLDRAGIELLVVPVPAKAAVHFDKLSRQANPAKGRIDAANLKFLQLLRDQKIEVLDLTDDFVRAASAAETEPYCRTDTHWSGVGCQIAARNIADTIKDRAWLGAVQRRKFEHETKPVDIVGDLSRALQPPSTERETLPLRFVGLKKDGALDPVESDPASPIVLLGDSHVLVFHEGGDLYARGAGLPDQLALELGLATDVVAVRGSGATAARINLMRNARADPDYLKSKKLVIWCFGVREFTQSDGWQKVPLAK